MAELLSSFFQKKYGHTETVPAAELPRKAKFHPGADAGARKPSAPQSAKEL